MKQSKPNLQTRRTGTQARGAPATHAKLGGPKSQEEVTEAVRHMQRRGQIPCPEVARVRGTGAFGFLKLGRVPSFRRETGEISLKFPLR